MPGLHCWNFTASQHCHHNTVTELRRAAIFQATTTDAKDHPMRNGSSQERHVSVDRLVEWNWWGRDISWHT